MTPQYQSRHESYLRGSVLYRSRSRAFTVGEGARLTTAFSFPNWHYREGRCFSRIAVDAGTDNPDGIGIPFKLLGAKVTATISNCSESSD